MTAEPGEVPRLVETKRPRLVVLPGTDGIALMETLLSLAGLPVIFISAEGAATLSRGRSRPAPPTTSSSRSRRPNSWRTPKWHCAGDPDPDAPSRLGHVAID